MATRLERMSTRPSFRRCSKSNCTQRAVATLSYNYAEQRATLTPLQKFQEPHTYDLCQEHSEGLTIPRGWQVNVETTVDLIGDVEEDFSAIADAVREVMSEVVEEKVEPVTSQAELRRRGHLRAL